MVPQTRLITVAIKRQARAANHSSAIRVYIATNRHPFESYVAQLKSIEIPTENYVVVFY